MATAKKLAPTAQRKWFTYAAAAIFLVVGCVLSFRYIAGSTLKEQKAVQQRDKDSKELAMKNPGNADAFSARLEFKRKEVEENEEIKRKKDVENQSSQGFPLGSSSAATSSTVAGGTVTSDPLKQSGVVRLARNAGMPEGRPGSAEPSDKQLDDYAASKDESKLAQNRKLSSWEDDKINKKDKRQGQTDPEMPNMGAEPQVPATLGSAALIEAYLKSQGNAQGGGAAAAASGNKDNAFLKTLDKGVSQPLRVQAGSGRFSILEGTSIPVVMRVSVSSDIGGPCRAAVAEDVYDSITGNVKLISAGSTIVCAYNSEVVQGQDKLLLAFTRLVFPNGTSVALGGMQASDVQGSIGAPAEVNTRFWQTFGSSFLVGLITKVAESGKSSAGTTINVGSTVTGTAASVLSEVAKKALERNSNIKAELRLFAGDRLNVIVTRDMVLDPSLSGVR